MDGRPAHRMADDSFFVKNLPFVQCASSKNALESQQKWISFLYFKNNESLCKNEYKNYGIFLLDLRNRAACSLNVITIFPMFVQSRKYDHTILHFRLFEDQIQVHDNVGHAY